MLLDVRKRAVLEILTKDKLSQEPSPGSSKELQPSNSQTTFQRKWAHTRIIGTLQLLALLKSRLAEEEPVILFNYFGMHKRCIELLRQIRAKENHKFVQYFTAGYMPHEAYIPNIVLLMHHVVRGSAQSSQALGVPVAKDGSQVVSRIIMSAGDIMKDYLRKNGDVACKELRIFSKNKKPIQDEIDYDKATSEELGYWFSIEEVLDQKTLTSLMTGVPVG